MFLKDQQRKFLTTTWSTSFDEILERINFFHFLFPLVFILKSDILGVHCVHGRELPRRKDAG